MTHGASVGCGLPSAGGCGRVFGDASDPSYSRDCRAAGNAVGFAGSRGGTRHAGLQWHVLPATWRASSCAGAEVFAGASERRYGVPSWRSGAHDGVQHEFRGTTHGLRPAGAVSAGADVCARVYCRAENFAFRQFAVPCWQFVRRIPRWSFSTSAQLASSARTEK
jgi:hypothetical protein